MEVYLYRLIPYKDFIVVNFKVCEINQDTRELIRTNNHVNNNKKISKF
jgi:hypothetical protein